MSGYNPGKVPACSSEHSPHQGGFEASSIESEGEPGKTLLDAAGYIGSMASEDGQGNMAAMASNASDHGRPTVSDYPEGITPSIDTSNPNGGGEASAKIAEFPHKGAPERTTSVGTTGGLNF